MNKTEIIKQAKLYFGKDRSHIKKLILSYEFDGTLYKQWKKEFKSILKNAIDIQFGIFDDVVINITNN
ncbi:MAG: hypothetical protein HYZ42_03495, partial [Bacteroidetes bacterium]|nr:hypothetical protein [Bacteroidota bacterium]